MNSLFPKDFDSFSTGRTSLSEVHLNIFNNSNIVSQLFGGCAVNLYFIDIGQGADFSAHNEYIDRQGRVTERECEHWISSADILYVDMKQKMQLN